LIRTLWATAWWSRLIDAARRALLRRSPWRERLIDHGRSVWRRRWLAIATAWLLCLIGWAGALLPPDHYRSSALLFADPGPGATLTSHPNGRTTATLIALRSALSTPAARARVAAAGALSAAANRQGERAPRIAIAVEAPALFRVWYEAERPDVARRALQTLVELVTSNQPPVVPAPGPGAPEGSAAELQASRDQAAALRNDLAAALMQRDARARQLAEVPPVLTAGRPNPIYDQIALQLGRQETLVAGLRNQLAATEAETARLDQQRAAGSRVGGIEQAGSGDQPGRVAAQAATAPAPPAGVGDHDRPGFQLVDPPDWPSAPEGVPRTLLLAAVLCAAIVAGAVAAAWHGQLDGTIDSASQLERRFQLPVLGTIATPAVAGQQRRRQRAQATFGLACLGLLGLFGGLVTAEGLDLLAPLAERLRGSVAG
jgi:hypothetical protein